MGVHEWTDPRILEAIDAGHLTRKDLAELRAVFHETDTNGDGVLSRSTIVKLAAIDLQLTFRCATPGTLSVNELQGLLRREDGQLRKLTEIRAIAEEARRFRFPDIHAVVVSMTDWRNRAQIDLDGNGEVDFYEFVHHFAHLGDVTPDWDSNGMLHDDVTCDICEGSVYGIRHVSTRKYTEFEGGHMGTYDVCMSCIDSRAAQSGAPYVHLTEPDPYFTPWEGQCPCRDCNSNSNEKNNEEEIPRHKKLKEAVIQHVKSEVAKQVATTVATAAIAGCCTVM